MQVLSWCATIMFSIHLHSFYSTFPHFNTSFLPFLTIIWETAQDVYSNLLKKKSEKERFNIENFGPEVWLMEVHVKIE